MLAQQLREFLANGGFAGLPNNGRRPRALRAGATGATGASPAVAAAPQDDAGPSRLQALEDDDTGWSSAASHPNWRVCGQGRRSSRMPLVDGAIKLGTLLFWSWM